MRTYKYILIVAALTLGVNAQTIYTTDQNIFDLVPDRDAISGLQGAQRIKAAFWEDNGYSLPLDVSGGLPIPLVISSTVDDYQITVLNSTTSAPPNVVWWVVPFLGAGQYRAQATITLPGDSFPVFDRFWSVTSAPPADISVSITGITVEANTIITNVVSSALNIYYWGTNVASVTNGP